MTESQSEKISNILQGWVPIVGAIVSFAVIWGIQTTRISADEDNIRTLQVNQQQYEQQTSQDISAMKVNIATITEDVNFIRNKVQ